MGAGRLELFLSGYDSPDKAIPSRTVNPPPLSTLQHRMEATASKTGKPAKNHQEVTAHVCRVTADVVLPF